MDNDDAIVGTIWSRRRALKLGLGVLVGGGLFDSLGCAADRPTAAVPLNAATTTRSPLIVSPAMTEGPFFVDEKLNRSNLVAGTARPAVINGAALQLNLTVLLLSLNGMTASPLTGAQVDVWHSDTAGIYSDEDDPMNPEVTSGQRWLRGYQLVDSSGAAQFSTIVPGWYEGRTPHIHFKIRQFSAVKKQTADFTSQFFFSDDALDRLYSNPPYNSRGPRNMRNADDDIFSERLKDGTVAGAYQTLALTPSGARKFVTNFTIIVSEASLHATPHGGPGFGPGLGPGPGGPPPDDGFGPQFWGF